MTDPFEALGKPEPKQAPEIGGVLREVYQVLEGRKLDQPEGSYTVKLLMGPQDKLLKKIAEESGEVIIAARDRNKGQLTYELADLLYHMLVVMVREEIDLPALAEEMAARRR